MKLFRRNTAAAVLLALSCSLTGVQCGLNVFSDSDDIKLGKQLDEEIRKNPKEYPVLQGRPDVREFVQKIAGSVLASPAITKRGVYAYHVEIIRNDSVINAFCTPGGYIYVYTGLLKFVENEATLAGVMGHEIGHAERRHATKRMTKAYGAQFLLGLLLGKNPSQIADVSANLFTGLALLANSRADEAESDEYSMKYLSATPYYPGAISYFFEKIQKEKSSRGGTLDRLLSTHPLPQDRIEHVRELLRAMGAGAPREENLFATRYLEFRKGLP